MLAILLALGGSISLGAGDFIAGVKARQLQVLPVLVVAQLTGLAVLAPAMLMVGGPAPTTASFWLLAALAGMGQLVGVATFWRSLEIGTMGIVAPISASSALLPLAVGLLQGERPVPVQAIGVALAAGGVVLTAYEPPSGGRRRARVASGVGLALFAAVSLGLFPVAIAAASDLGSALWAVFAGRLCSCAVIALPAIRLRRHATGLRAALPPLAAVGVLEILGLFLIAAATTHGLLTIVGVISALYPVTTVGLAWLVLKERLHAVQRCGAVMALTGIVAVSVAAT